MNFLLGWIPGYKNEIMRSQLRMGYYDAAPELKSKVERYLYGPKSGEPAGQQEASPPVPVLDLRNRGDINEGNFFRVVEDAAKRQERAAAKTEQAMDKMNRNQPRTTLAHPDVDR